MPSKIKATRESQMDRTKLGKMSVEELWTLHAEVADTLSRRMRAEKAKLEVRLRKVLGVEQKRRPYPKVFPKYSNPKNPNETWSGRGKQPRWVASQLGSG